MASDGGACELVEMAATRSAAPRRPMLLGMHMKKVAEGEWEEC
jgi:hypothetical protein